LPFALAGCAAYAGGVLVGPAISLAYSPPPVAGGNGKLDAAATARLGARAHAALATATRDALGAAAAALGDVRLQRRAAAMMRSLGGDADARKLADFDPAPMLAHLVEVAPCPGLADAAATWIALGDDTRGGQAYARAARQCDSVEAAVAAVRPLRSANRCDEALDVLRAAWPHAKGEQGIAVLDGVTACSDAITLRRNLAFVPPDVVEDYFALLEARHREAVEAERRADAERREQEAASRAFEQSSHCESECSAAVSSCESSCVGNSSCLQRCSAVGHTCRAGC
jgi:hypothetical protein